MKRVKKKKKKSRTTLATDLWEGATEVVDHQSRTILQQELTRKNVRPGLVKTVPGALAVANVPVTKGPEA